MNCQMSFFSVYMQTKWLGHLTYNDLVIGAVRKGIRPKLLLWAHSSLHDEAIYDTEAPWYTPCPQKSVCLNTNRHNYD